MHCIVRNKKVCWSTNHSKEERIISLRENRQVRQFFTAVQDDSSDEIRMTYDVGDQEVDEDTLDELEDLAGGARIVQVNIDVEREADEQATSFFATPKNTDSTTAYIA